MHLKKLLALGLSLTMAVALLSGCGQQPFRHFSGRTGE